MNGQDSGGNPVSGRIAGVAVDPTNSNTIYVAAAGGGVWKTTNGGSNWTPLTDNQATLSMGAIAVAPSNPNIIYAGTGEANNSVDSNFGQGILVSTDAGKSWTLENDGGIFKDSNVARIVIDPLNPEIAYVALDSPYAENGIWKTTDGGSTWTNTTISITNDQPYSDLAIDPANPEILYAAIGGVSGSTFSGVYKSLDGGSTWSILTGVPNGDSDGRIMLAISQSDPNTLYVTISEPYTSSGTGLYEFLNTNDGGATFTDLSTTPNYLGSQGWYANAVIVDPTNPNIVYAAGFHVIQSMDGGSTWKIIDVGANGTGPHVDHHGFAFTETGTLLDVNDGGIWGLVNSSPTNIQWSDLNGNLDTIQIEGISVDPTNPNTAVIGSQDNGTAVFTDGSGWSLTDGGDGGKVAFSSTNSNRVYHQIPNASFGINFFRRSDNAGQSWTTQTSSIASDVNVQNFYAPFVVDPNNGNHVLYGTDRIWESFDGGTSWNPISNLGVNGWSSSGTVNAVGLSSSNTNVIYADTSSGFFSTTNHGLSWTQSSTIPFAAAYVSDIEVDPSNPQIAYVTTGIGYFDAGGVYQTTDGGQTWTNIDGNLSAMPVFKLQIAPTGSSSDVLYIGTENGVYSSSNDGGSWSRFGVGLPNAQVYDLEYLPQQNTLVAGTHGRGMWEILTQSTTITNVTSTNANGDYGIGSVITIQIEFNDRVTVAGDPELLLNSGGVANYTGGSGTNTLTFSYTIASGQSSIDLDTVSTNSLILNGGSILDVSNSPANLALPSPGTAGSLSANKTIIIDGVAPSVVGYFVLFGSESYNLLGSSRFDLPWEITGIKVQFSKPIESASVSSLTGLNGLALTGLGTDYLTWSFNPIDIGVFSTQLLSSGNYAIKDSVGNELNDGTNFSQNIRILFGDYNGDGVVTIRDLVEEDSLIQSGNYSVFGDIIGAGTFSGSDGTTDLIDIRKRMGTQLP